MTEPGPTMTSEELIGQAALDAFGLLDPYETDLYRSSLLTAPPVVQEEVRRIQAEIVSDPLLLPNVAPPTSLRKRVLAAVGEAIDRDAVQLAPIASIGRRDVGGGGGSIAHGGQLWRAVALILVGIVVVLSIFGNDTYQRVNRLTDVALDLRTQDQIDDLIGTDYLAFLNNPSCRVSFLAPSAGEHRGLARLAVNERTHEAFLLVMDLPKSGEPYTLWARTADGRRTALVTFSVRGPVAGVRLAGIEPGVVVSAILEITDGRGGLVLVGA